VNAGHVGVVARDQVGSALNQGHRGAEPVQRLGEFHADRPAPDHREPARQLAQVEDVLVGEVADLG
jgi:hypothetical protein